MSDQPQVNAGDIVSCVTGKDKNWGNHPTFQIISSNDDTPFEEGDITTSWRATDDPASYGLTRYEEPEYIVTAEDLDNRITEIKSPLQSGIKGSGRSIPPSMRNQ